MPVAAEPERLEAADLGSSSARLRDGVTLDQAQAELDA